MIYVGHGLLAVARHRTEPALIDPTLSVAAANAARDGAGMGYWPSYDTISPENRAAYLEWLESGRRNPSAYIGYVFLFLYGLERRVFADSATSADAARELALIRDEVQTLLDIYGHNGSFRRYAGQLRDILDAGSPTLEPPMQREGLEMPLPFRIMVGRFVESRTAVPVEWALSWYLTHPETYLRTPAQRCRREFEALFRVRFASRFPDGFVVKSVNKSSLKISITPASASFAGTIDHAFGIPDIGRLTAPVSKLREIGEQCAADLDAFSRWVGKNPDRQKTAAALAMLPAELVSAHEDSETKDLWTWLESTLAPHDRIVCTADALLRHCPSFGAGKLAKSEAVILAQLLEKRGYGIEPDVRFGGTPIARGEVVVLFKLPQNAISIASPNYAAATVLMHLAVAVASADGTISEAEELRLQAHMTDALKLQTGEAYRLAAHMTWLQQARPGFTGLKKRLEPLDDQQRTAIAEFAISVAGADGHVSPEEIKTLGKIYPLLGLPANTVYSHVHAMTTAATETVSQDEPITIAPRETRSTYTIPQRPSVTASVRLNMDAVSAKLAESAKISAILDGIFNEDDAALPPPPSVAPLPSTGKLGGGHGALLSRLVERQQWSRIEFEQLTQTFGLMPDGAVDAINEAGYEHAAGPVLDGDDPIDVDITVAKELLG